MGIFSMLKGKEKVKTIKKVKPKKTKMIKKTKKAVKRKPSPKKIKKAIRKQKIKKIRKTLRKKAAKAEKKVAVKAPTKADTNKLDDKKAYEMVKAAKIPVVKYFFCKKENEISGALKKSGFPCVMKVSGRSIIHKSELGGVIRDIDSEEKGTEAFNSLMKINGAEAVIIQEQKEGKELLIGSKSDQQFGNIISLGIGGVLVEIIKDVTFRVCPISKGDAEQMVKELRGYELLANSNINLEKVYDVLVRASKLAADKKVKEMDINPLICNEQGCWAVDVRIFK